MDVCRTPEQHTLVWRAVASGRFQREEDVVHEALSLWEDRERNRATLLAALDAAEEDLESGHFTDHTDASLPQLAADLKREARALRAADDKR